MITDLSFIHRPSVTGNRHALLAHADALLICVLRSTTAVHINLQETRHEDLYPQRQHTHVMDSRAHQFLRPVQTEKKHRILPQMLQMAMSVLDRCLALPRWDGSGTLEVPHHTMVAVISDISQLHL
jgi:hypothetical protein